MAPEIISSDKEQRDKELFERLKQEHPDYEEWKKNWELYRDLLGDAEPALENYLPQGNFESNDVYATRLALAEFIPESPIAVNKVIEAVYDKQPTRDFTSSPGLLEFSKNVDLRGTRIDDYSERVARRLVGYGTTRLLINMRRPRDIPADRTLTVEEERRLGVRPYAVNYSPLSIINWEYDRYQKLIYVRIKEHSITRAADGIGHETVIRFIDYDEEKSTYWEFHKSDDDKLVLVEGPVNSLHNLGVVPLIVENYPDEIRPMIGASFIRWMGRADKRKIQAESDLHYDTYIHAHPVMVYQGSVPLGEIGLGAHSYLKIKEGEKIEYLDLPQSISEAIQRVIDLNMQAMYRHAGTDPLGVLMPGTAVFETSGVSRAWSFGTSEARKLKDIALKMQRIESRMYNLVERWLSPGSRSADDTSFDGMVEYPEEYDPSSTVVLMDNAERARDLVASQTLGKVLTKRIAALLAGEVKPEIIEKIMKEIDQNPIIGFSGELPALQTARGKLVNGSSSPPSTTSTPPASQSKTTGTRRRL